MNTKEQERKDFEECTDISSCVRYCDIRNKYLYESTFLTAPNIQDKWEGWQARAAKVPNIPEPTEDDIRFGWSVNFDYLLKIHDATGGEVGEEDVEHVIKAMLNEEG